MNNSFKKEIDLIDNYLEEICNDFEVELLKEAVLYSLLAGGKRLRSLIVLLILDDLNLDINKGLDAACAIEMIHTYSLIHDDLPSMDDDDIRRGKPTCHLVYGEGIAILAGDALLTESFKVISHSNYLTDSEKVKTIQILSHKAGANGMVGGQVLDISSVDQELTVEQIYKIHEKKTKDLIESSVLIGSLLAGILDSREEELLKLTLNLGLAFQIQDDLLDLSSTNIFIDKPKGSDEKNNKSTYPHIVGKGKALKDYLFFRNKTLEITENIFGKKRLFVFLEGVLNERF